MRTLGIEKAEPLLGTVTVGDAMHHGIVTCAPTAGLREVAAALADNRIHCVVVADAAGTDDARAVWGIVSDVDLMRGLGSPVALTAGNLAALDVTLAPEDSLERAAQVMAEHEISHVVVVADGRPAGVLSTLDIATAVASADPPSDDR